MQMISWYLRYRRQRGSRYRSIRRRRSCGQCGGRFTTFERIQLRDMIIVKSDGKRQPFDREKVIKSMQVALQKRPISTEKIEKADRLLKLQVRLGEEERQLVAGIAQHYTPDELVGKKVVMVANLKPAKIRGVESRGMILAASAGADIFLLTPERPLPPGSQIK